MPATGSNAFLENTPMRQPVDATKSSPDFATVTEVPGNKITTEAWAMMWTRYAFAAELGRGKDILEVACGAGTGLGHLAERARSVTGGDYTECLVLQARKHYGDRMPLLVLDACALPFCESTFDLLMLFEAVYYLPRPADFISESRRVLRAGGILLISSVNPEWRDFHPSPYSRRYYSAEELKALLSDSFHTTMYGAFPTGKETAPGKLLSMAKRAASRLHLIPRTMKGKAWLKRLCYGPLITVPPELGGPVPTIERPRAPGPGESWADFKVIYAVGEKPSVEKG